MSTDAFGIEKESLEGLLHQVSTGDAQLPEFQRGWVWPVENMISLLASISLAYPVGTLMLLRTGGDSVRFKQRLVEGVELSNGVKAERLILDGQQRMTSLYQALRFQSPVETHDARKRRVSGWFYADIARTLETTTDREEAIRFLPADRVVRSFRGEMVEDYSTREREYEAGMFPLIHVFDADEWEDGYEDFWGYDVDRRKQWKEFRKTFIKQFQAYMMPVIELGRETPKHAVCQVFEKVNTGGVSLTVFELLTATFAADEFDLRKDWDERKQELKRPELKILTDLKDTDFLQAVTLLATRARRERQLSQGMDSERAARIGCRRADMLDLTLDDYQQHAPSVMAGLKAAAKFLHQERFFDPKFLPYGSQIVPLAAILAVLGNEAEPQTAREKLGKWFWCGVLGELYGGTTETRFARDLPDVVAWIRGDTTEPRTVTEALFAAARLRTLRTRNSAAYKGIYTLLLSEGAVDWRTGHAIDVEHYFDEAVDIHHIFPQNWCNTEKIAPSVYNSIVNKTPLTARTNRSIGGRAPSEYRGRLANSAEISFDQLDSNVGTHLVALDELWSDNFDGFMAARTKVMLGLISRAMDKPITPESGNDDVEVDEEPDDD